MQVGIPGVRALRKPPRRSEAPREMTELERVREKMAKRMQERLRAMEEQDVADSWEEPEASAAAPIAPAPLNAIRADPK